ncbi:Macrophage-expressed protein 1 protein [Bulinus truncatus]|nr:Macrophage-expressed protein 1 protein [Bulinus truncatus]
MMKQHIALVLVTLLIDCNVAAPSGDLQETSNTVIQSDWPIGDSRRCIDRLRLSQMDASRFDVLPGVGWDNLRNLEASLVVTYNFTLCKLTDDGNFLIPDNVFTIPIKTSKVERFAELIDQWQTSSSLTANSINVEAGLSLSQFSISGKYSSEHQELKSKQYEDKAITARVQMRYDRYEVKLQPDPVLSPQFKSRLLSIAARIELNQTEQARYEGQVLIRDFGTHVLTSVTAGAALVKDDYITKSYLKSNTETKSSILKSASASFMGIFKFSSSFSNVAGNNVSNSYSSAVTHSQIKTLGGSLFQLENSSLDSWTKDVDRNLVPMDRIGDPLSFLVTPQTLPELPPSTVNAVGEIVLQSIELYYEMNTVRGCTDEASPNFSFAANLDDGSCEAITTNLTFGGFFQNCSVSGNYLYSNPCSGLDSVNPKTGGYSCPSSYTAILIQSAYRSGSTESQRNCDSCYLFFHCCETKQYQAYALYSAYWCAALGAVPRNSGYLFGGLYRPSQDNPFTGKASCPPTFYPKQLLLDLYICISDDFEQSTKSAVPFGGFFSCSKGNPLVAQGDMEKTNNLSTFESKQENAYLKSCPEGYSQHLATMDMGCSIYYCVKSGFMSGSKLPAIKRPPFSVKPSSFNDDKDNLVIFNTDTQLIFLKNKNFIICSLYIFLKNFSACKYKILIFLESQKMT